MNCRNISLHILCNSIFSVLSPERPIAIRHQDGAYGLTLYFSNLSSDAGYPFWQLRPCNVYLLGLYCRKPHCHNLDELKPRLSNSVSYFARYIISRIAILLLTSQHPYLNQARKKTQQLQRRKKERLLSLTETVSLFSEGQIFAKQKTMHVQN